MGLVFFVFTTIRRCIDILCFMLDLNFWLVNSVVRLLVWLIAFVNNLPVLLTNVVVDCWNLTQFCVLTAVEVISTAAHDTINLLGGWLRLLGGVTEGIKMLGHLFVHVQLRAKELLNRGLLSGHCMLRQLWEGCGIVLSLVLYFINTIINMLLLAMHKCYFVAVGLWEVVSGPLENTLELAVTLVTFLYSSLVGTSILLWTPCQLALEFLGSLGHIFLSVFLLNPYGLLFTSAIVAVVTLYFNPSLARRGAHHTLQYINTIPTLHRLQRVLHSVYLLALERAQTLLEIYVWQRAAWQGSHLGRGRRDTAVAYGGGLVGNDRVSRHPAGNVEQGLPAGGGTLAVAAPLQLQDTELEDDALNLVPPCSSTDRPLQKSSLAEGHKSSSGDSLLSLLKEQEERKKCVICQDSAKTVVLLPCRHLCLCRDCTDILLRQPIYQHNCPLCRHMILQTMDVYI